VCVHTCVHVCVHVCVHACVCLYACMCTRACDNVNDDHTMKYCTPERIDVYYIFICEVAKPE